MVIPKVAICVGHDSLEQGAIAVSPINQTEYAFNTEFAQILSKRLDRGFRPTIYFRDGLGIKKLYDELDKLKPDICIELHFNSSSDKSARGTETLCSVHSYDFARIVQKNLCQALNRKGKEDRGVKLLCNPSDRGWHSVSRLACPNVLVESFFGSNTRDCTLAKEKVNEMAIALEVSCQEWFVGILKASRG